MVSEGKSGTFEMQWLKSFFTLWLKTCFKRGRLNECKKNTSSSKQILKQLFEMLN